jgi:hypothetical protein
LSASKTGKSNVRGDMAIAFLWSAAPTGSEQPRRRPVQWCTPITSDPEPGRHVTSAGAPAEMAFSLAVTLEPVALA